MKDVTHSRRNRGDKRPLQVMMGPLGQIIYAAAAPLGPDGDEIRRSKWEYPYSYDAFVIWGSLPESPPEGLYTVYTDRLDSWVGGYDRYEELRTKHLVGKCLNGAGWSGVPAAAAEAFLREGLKDPDLVPLRLSEYCNVATGYPVWRIDYLHGKQWVQVKNLELELHRAHRTLQELTGSWRESAALPEEVTAADESIKSAQMAFTKASEEFAARLG